MIMDAVMATTPADERRARDSPREPSSGAPVLHLSCCTSGGEDYVRVDVNSLKLLLDWARLAQDRESWRDKIQELLGHTQSTMLEMCD